MMNRKPIPHVKLWLITALVFVFWGASVIFQQGLNARDETYKGLRLFTDVIEMIERNYVEPVDAEELIQNAIEGMLKGLDPHSAFLKPDALKDLQLDTQGEFTGIGISISMRDDRVTVVAPIEGTPAFRAGIQAGDIILKIDGEPARDLRDAVNRIRGPKGTEVQVTIQRPDVADPLEFTLTRDVIPIESVRYTTLQPGYGYIWITNFRETTTTDLKAALNQLRSAEAPLKGLVLDLRNNPGGLLNQAIEVADVFIEEGTLLSIKGRQGGNSKVFKAQARDTFSNVPMIVLINGGSASASEIVAGALQDQKRALLLGTPSFGKGSVQTVESLREGYGLKLTIARYYTPSGRSIQATGIEPDIRVPFTIRAADEESEAETKHPREQDLENHLDSDSSFDSSSEKPETKALNDLPDDPLSLKRLTRDEQVMRALELLISYEVFKGMNS